MFTPRSTSKDRSKEVEENDNLGKTIDIINLWEAAKKYIFLWQGH